MTISNASMRFLDLLSPVVSTGIYDKFSHLISQVLHSLVVETAFDESYCDTFFVFRAGHAEPTYVPNPRR